MDKVNYELAMDFSGSYLNFAIREIGNSNVIANISKLIQRRESSKISEIFCEELAKLNISIDDIKRFSVGSGPGNFTGMRIAASLISGITFGKADVQTRCVPSAFAIAKSASIANNEKMALLFDGRNKEIILFEVTMIDDKIQATSFEAILNKDASARFFVDNKFDKIAALSYDLEAIKLIAPAVVETESFVVIDNVNAENLLAENLVIFDNDLTNLHYIRPSVSN